MSDKTDALLSELLEVQRRMLAAQEQALANQREVIDRQRAIIRRTFPLFILLLVASIGPYVWSLLAYFANR